MKKKAMMLAALMMAAVTVQANNTVQKNQVVTTSSVKLSSDEQAFSAKLNDQNRANFCEKLSEEQRQAVMVAAKNGANADDGVAHMITAQGLKADSVVDAVGVDVVTESVK